MMRRKEKAGSAMDPETEMTKCDRTREQRGTGRYSDSIQRWEQTDGAAGASCCCPTETEGTLQGRRMSAERPGFGREGETTDSDTRGHETEREQHCVYCCVYGRTCVCVCVLVLAVIQQSGRWLCDIEKLFLPLGRLRHRSGCSRAHVIRMCCLMKDWTVCAETLQFVRAWFKWSPLIFAH